MKKIYLIILLTISSLTFGQNNCDELKAENENLKRQISEMKKNFTNNYINKRGSGRRY